MIKLAPGCARQESRWSPEQCCVGTQTVHNKVDLGATKTRTPTADCRTVVKGKAIGRTLDYPTANLKPSETYKLIPQNGVYVTQASINGEKTIGITSIGTNPTVGGKKKTIETYFLDFDGDLYEKHLNLEFLTHIRDEETFDSKEALKKAIQQDEAFARDYLEQNG